MNQRLEEIPFSGIVALRDRLLKMPQPLRLESGEPSFDTPDHIKEAMNRALRDNQTHYAPSTGILPLREAILRKVIRENGIDYLTGPDQVVVTNGGMHAIYVALQTILNPGEEVIIPQPVWTATAWMIRLAGGELRPVRLQPSLNFRWDLEELEAAVSSATRAILLNTPHNPTGGVLTKEDLEGILDIAARHRLYVIADEAYEHIIYDHEHVSIAGLAADRDRELRDRIITCFTFSKSYAMTGWRLGYLVCSDPEFHKQVKKMVLYTINGVSTPTQWGGLAALEGSQECVAAMRDSYRERRDMLFEGVNRSEYLRCERPPDGAFYLWADITESWQGTPSELAEHLVDEYALGSVPADAFLDDRPALRFSYACDTEMIQQAIDSLSGKRAAV